MGSYVLYMCGMTWLAFFLWSSPASSRFRYWIVANNEWVPPHDLSECGGKAFP